MLRSPIKAAWLTARKEELEALARRKCSVRVHKVDGERAHVGEGFAGDADFLEMFVDGKLGVAVPGHKASNLGQEGQDRGCRGY